MPRMTGYTCDIVNGKIKTAEGIVSSEKKPYEGK